LKVDDKTPILTSLSDLVSSSFITISQITYTLTENLPQDSNPLNFDWEYLYPFAQTVTSSTPLTGSTVTDLSSFLTFPNIPFSIPWPSSPYLLNIEAPCTSTTSSFDYSLTPALPAWLTFTPTDASST